MPDLNASPTADSLVRSRAWRVALLISVCICAASGLVYELALLTLSTSLNGGGIVETSLIVAGYVASLGLGALMAKPFLSWPASSFLIVETLLGLCGGVSAVVLYMVFALVGQSTLILVVATLLIGILVGMEVPLLMTLIQRGRTSNAEDSGSVVANLNFADYVGGLLGGLAWPFILLPWLGMIRGTAAAGLVNLIAALVVALLLLRTVLSGKQLLMHVLALLGAIALLLTLIIRSESIVVTARQSLYEDPVIYAHTSDYQDIVVTKRGKDSRLYLNGGLQYSSRDEYRYTESLVYPVLPAEPGGRVLVIGGGDGLAARELLKMDFKVTQVELDPEVVNVANTVLREDNGGAMEDPRVRILNEDAFTWLRSGGDHTLYDAVLIDLPDPDSAAMARLYSEEFYSMAHKMLAPGGKMVVQATSAFSTPDVFWRIDSTLRSAGCPTVPYHVHVPTFGDWGFVACAEEISVPSYAPPLRYLNDATLEAAQSFGLDNQPRNLPASTLDHPYVVDDLRRGYRQAGD